MIYECHVKGMTIKHPDVPEHLRGTYLGLCSDPMIDYFQALGVTAVELLPVHQFVIDRHLPRRGLTNYWGYNSIGFFAPDVRYATRGLGNQVYEFKIDGEDVSLGRHRGHSRRRLQPHRRGEPPRADALAQGIDNRAYYRLDENKRFYTDFTGTGNSLNMRTRARSS